MIIRDLPLHVQIFVKVLKNNPNFKIGYSKKNNCIKLYSFYEKSTYFIYIDRWAATEFDDLGRCIVKANHRSYSIWLNTGLIYV